MTFINVTDMCCVAFTYRTAASTCLKVNTSEPRAQPGQGKAAAICQSSALLQGLLLIAQEFLEGGKLRGPPTTQAISSDVAFYYYYLFRL